MAAYPLGVDPTLDLFDRDEAHHRIGGPIHEAEVVGPGGEIGQDDVGPWGADELREDAGRPGPRA
jgi:hypothetical protein